MKLIYCSYINNFIFSKINILYIEFKKEQINLITAFQPLIKNKSINFDEI